MSQKVDNDGNIIGAYTAKDLDSFWPEQKPKSRKTDRQRVLHYEPIWTITEMQVKLGVRAKIPKPIGPLMTQLAKQISTPTGGESRSMALEKDMEIVAAASDKPNKTPQNPEEPTGNKSETLEDVLGAEGAQFVDDLVAEHHEVSLGSPTTPQQHSRSHPPAEGPPRDRKPPAEIFTRDFYRSLPLTQSRPQAISHNPPTTQRSSSTSDFSRPDGRRREGMPSTPLSQYPILIHDS